jgi:ribosomal protein L37AE/L43A
MKPCFKCGETKPLSEFYPHGQMKDKHRNKCKVCTIEEVRKDRRLNPAVQARDRARGNRQTADGLRAYREKNPQAYKAQTAVSNAVRDKRLFKEPCLFCGNEKVHGHHRDYSRPLDVIWLCAKCHHRLHAYFPETAAHEPKEPIRAAE